MAQNYSHFGRFKFKVPKIGHFFNFKLELVAKGVK